MKQDVIKQAKKHLQKRNEVIPDENNNNYFFFSRKLNRKEIERYRRITAEIAASDEFLNPLEKLIDHNEFDPLPEENKMRYLLELCALYVTLKKSLN